MIATIIQHKQKATQEIASIIHLGDVIFHEIDLQGTGEGFSPPIDEKNIRSVGLTSQDLSTVKAN